MTGMATDESGETGVPGGSEAEQETDLCLFPGEQPCPRPRRADPKTGRPTKYCEQADEPGAPIKGKLAQALEA